MKFIVLVALRWTALAARTAWRAAIASTSAKLPSTPSKHMILRTSSTFFLCLVLAGCGSSGESTDDDDTGADAVLGDTQEDTADDIADDTQSEPDAEADSEDDAAEDVLTDAVTDAEEDAEEDVLLDIDAEEDIQADAPDVEQDVEQDVVEGCVQVSITGDWAIERDDDVSIGYKTTVAPPVDGGFLELTLLFERYSIEQDIGIFDLSEGQDANYGGCAHCVVMRSAANLNVYYAAEGQLEALEDPYNRSYRANMTGLRLVESTISRETRESTPVPGGGCVEIADFQLDVAFAANGWTCAPEAYNDDETCNCECGAWDPDCNVVTECPPFDPSCELQDELPLAGCEEGLTCEFDPISFAGSCTEGCNWDAREGCAEGICIYEFGTGDGPICVSDEERVSDVAIGDFCTVSDLQQFCAIDDGFSTGYCGPANVCRPVCASNDACNEAGETCRFFRFEGEGLGYCGPEPGDG
ncbi:MAG: hypothetical protein ACJA1R_003117 [Flavobacteriales bacterium]